MHRKKAELRGGEDGQGAGARRRSGAESRVASLRCTEHCTEHAAKREVFCIWHKTRSRYKTPDVRRGT